jgi:hypothetical protein
MKYMMFVVADPAAAAGATFDILKCDDLDEAIAIATQHPQANGGKLELRPFWTGED